MPKAKTTICNEVMTRTVIKSAQTKRNLVLKTNKHKPNCRCMSF